MNAQTLFRSIRLAVGLLLVTGGWAAAQPQPGECASGFCGTPKNNGGGGCGCGGGSILVNNTDIGETYSKTDDYDADGLADDFDNCPFMANREQADTDGDKIGDSCDNCAALANPDQHDVNLNGTGDVCDADIDGDKILNAEDNCPMVPNVAQTNSDPASDKLGDVCDPDMDGDGVVNRVDNCPLVANADQGKDAPGRFGSACDTDSDKDAVEDAKDNCPVNYNPDQIDLNANDQGDVCDLDMDGDGAPNQLDNCPSVPNVDKAGNQPDADRNGVGDACQTHGFCFVASKNQGARCLDPKSVFSVTAAPRVRSTTGNRVLPTFYANRDGVTIQYSWVVTQQPDGSSSTVSHPRGTVSESSAFEYHYGAQGDRPEFVPTHPGVYKLNLAADLVQPDSQYPGVVHAESEVEIEVTGPISGTTGCALAGRSAASSGFAMLGLLLAAASVLRRRRRS